MIRSEPFILLPFIRARRTSFWICWAGICGALLLSARNTQAGLASFRPLTPTDWLGAQIANQHHLELVASARLTLLDRYRQPAVERMPEWRHYARGEYGMERWWRAFPKLGWSALSCEPAPPSGEASQMFEPMSQGRSIERGLSLEKGLSRQNAPVESWALGALFRQLVPEPLALDVERRPDCPRWKRPKPVTLVRYDGTERETLSLLDCEHAIADEAVDRVSVLARPPGVERPLLPLPEEPGSPGPRADPYEWVSDVRLIHPRLIFLLELIAEAYPNRAIYIMSGYRQSGHSSFHRSGRALDLFVQGVDNESLFRLCSSFRDVGCGYYPNSRFVHFDVRPYGTRQVLWVDVSSPGTPSEYVSSYPGVLSHERLLPRAPPQ